MEKSDLSSNIQIQLNEDVENDLKNLLACVKCHQDAKEILVVQEALKTIIAVCANCSNAKDLFRDIGGLQFLMKMVFCTKRISLLESCLKTLACMIDENVYNQKQLTMQEVFELIRGLLNSKEASPSLLKNVVYFTSALLYQNIGAQVLIQKTECLQDFVSLYERLFPTFMLENHSSVCENKEDHQPSIELWLTVNTLLSFSVNNPLNEKNQRICSDLFPLALKILQFSSSYKIINAVSSFLSLVIADNVHNQDLMAEYDGMVVLQQLLRKNVISVVNDITKYGHIVCKGKAQCSISAVGVVDTTLSEHEENSELFGKLGGVTLLLKLLSIEELKEVGKTKIIITLGHCINACEKNRFYILQEENFPLMLKKIMLCGERDLLIACKYLLLECVKEDDNSRNQCMSNDLITICNDKVEKHMPSSTRGQSQMKNNTFDKQVQDNDEETIFPISQCFKVNNSFSAKRDRSELPFQQDQVLHNNKRCCHQEKDTHCTCALCVYDNRIKESISENITCNRDYFNFFQAKKCKIEEKKCSRFQNNYDTGICSGFCCKRNSSYHNLDHIDPPSCNVISPKNTYFACHKSNKSGNGFVNSQCGKLYGTHSHRLSCHCCKDGKAVMHGNNIMRNCCPEVNSYTPQKCQKNNSEEKCDIHENCLEICKKTTEFDKRNDAKACACNCRKKNSISDKKLAPECLVEASLATKTSEVRNISHEEKSLEEDSIFKKPLKTVNSNLMQIKTSTDYKQIPMRTFPASSFSTPNVTPNFKNKKICISLNKGTLGEQRIPFSPFRKIPAKKNPNLNFESLCSDAFSVSDMKLLHSTTKSSELCVPKTSSPKPSSSPRLLLNIEKVNECTSQHQSLERRNIANEKEKATDSDFLPSSKNRTKYTHVNLTPPAHFPQISSNSLKRSKNRGESRILNSREDANQTSARISSSSNTIEVITLSDSTCFEHNLSNSSQAFQVILLD